MMRRLREDVWLLELGFRAPLDANAYLIDERERPDSLAATEPRAAGTDGGERDGEVVLVDTGIRYNRGSLRSELSAAGYEPADVDRVLVTHYDLDHVGGLDRYDFDCPIHVGERDLGLARGDWSPDLTHHKGLWHRITRRLFPLPEDADFRSVADGDVVGRFRAFHTPGHNPGHTVYVHDSGVAFLGDLVWETDGEYTTPFWADSYDMYQLRESIRQFAERTPDFELACVGHGVPFVERGSERFRAFAAEL
jgi:glyoxylase-like metal-dependent hydrolase (beta-lactamase superfamily II)